MGVPGLVRWFAVAALWLAHGSAAATTVVFTYEGTVWNLSDPEGRIAAAGLSTGTDVTYTVLVDFDRGGFKVDDGVVEPYVDETTDDYVIEFFFAEFLSGGPLVDYGYHPDSVDRMRYSGFDEYDLTDPLNPIEGTVAVGKSLSFSAPVLVEDWAVGTSVGTNELVVNPNGFGFVWTRGTITSLEVVPEPGASLLLALGLGAALRRR